MKKQKNNILLIFILTIILFILISAYIIQYKLGHEPCNLCLYERIPYILSTLLLIRILFFKKYKKVILLIISIVFIISTILAFYHFGIEQDFFEESLVCKTTNLSETLNKEQLLEELKQKSVSCKYVSFKILGFSLATINTIFSFLLSVIFMRLFINYGKN